MRNLLLIPLALLSFKKAVSQDLQFQVTDSTTFINSRYSEMAVADVDNDGDMDVLTIGEGHDFPREAILYANDGKGNFSVLEGNDLGQIMGKAHFADLDGDNDQDLILYGTNRGGINLIDLYFNNGAGKFQKKADNFLTLKHGDFAIGDIDNDGDVDVIITGTDSKDDEYSKIYLNNGKGVFTEKVQFTLSSIVASDIELFDFDNDDKLDLLVAGKTGSGRATTFITDLYKNTGNGEFRFEAEAT